MRKQIKSSYIFEKIFSYIDESKKLEIVKYAKDIQKVLNIDIINYRLFSGKYIIGEKNGICKVYDYNDNLIFVGEYLNGKRNGKGKEYNIYGELLFEGEYLNGKKWNGIGYYIEIDNYNKYDVSKKMEDAKGYLNKHNFFYELIDGKGYMIDYDDKEFIYEGEYLNGERNGNGREYKILGNNNLLIDDGEYLNGKRNGKGKEYQAKDVQSAIFSSAKLSFEGYYSNGRKWNGKGYDNFKNIAYEIKNGKGYIKEYCNDKIIFEGEYLNVEVNGK